MTTKALERELIGYALGDAPPSTALRQWLATPEGKLGLARQRRVLRALDAWGTAVATSEVSGRRAQAVPAVIAAEPVYYGALTTTLGPVLAAVGARGLVGVSFERSARAFAATLAARHSTRVVRADDRLTEVRAQLADYLDGTRRRFELPIDLRHVSAFQRQVLAAARRIPRGRVASYGEIARRIGRPGASRAVGQALGRNPVPIVIPCHRVVAGGGALGGYVGGSAIKERLLALEGVERATGT